LKACLRSILKGDSMNETPATKVLPQRRWFQLRLRTLLVLVTLVSMLLGWISWEQERRRQEQTMIAWVEEVGGHRNLGFWGISWWNRKVVATTDKFFGELLREIWLTKTNVTDLSPLAGLKNLEFLHLEKLKVDDLSPLAELKSLKFINLSNTLVSDLAPLAGLKNLEVLRLSDTAVSDLTPLAELNRLEGLNLYALSVSLA
jgi:hypothetical protein